MFRKQISINRRRTCFSRQWNVRLGNTVMNSHQYQTIRFKIKHCYTKQSRGIYIQIRVNSTMWLSPSIVQSFDLPLEIDTRWRKAKKPTENNNNNNETVKTEMIIIKISMYMWRHQFSVILYTVSLRGERWQRSVCQSPTVPECPLESVSLPVYAATGTDSSCWCGRDPLKRLRIAWTARVNGLRRFRDLDADTPVSLDDGSVASMSSWPSASIAAAYGLTAAAALIGPTPGEP